jgi:hypothetical protein
MLRTRFLLGLLAPVALAVASSGCVSTHRADLRALGHRAVYDLGCPIQHLQVDHVDARTKAVGGCGRRLIYVEDCDRHDGSITCTWRVDTPSVEQQTWPQAFAAYQRPEAAAPLGRTLPTELFDPGEEPTVASAPADPLAMPPATASPGRPFATDLFQPGTDRTPSERPPRAIRSGLQSDDDAPAPSPRKVRTELFPEPVPAQPVPAQPVPARPVPAKPGPTKADPSNPFDM